MKLIWLTPATMVIGCAGEGSGESCTYEAPEVYPIGTLDGAPYYDDDCPGGAPGDAIVIAGVRLCPDAQVLGAGWPSYPTHSWSDPASGDEPGIDPAAFAARFTADADAADVAGYGWVLIDATAPRSEMVLASGGGGVARTQADDPTAPAGGAPMGVDTFGLIGSVSKLVSSMFFLRMLEDLALDPARNPSGLTAPQLLELPAWHFLPRDWKGCIDNSGCGVDLSAGEGPDTDNDSFKGVRLRELIDHTSGLGVAGGDFGTERLWGYMVSGTEKYNLSGGVNNTPGAYDYENVNVRFLAALFYGLSAPLGRAELSRLTECDDGSGSGEIPAQLAPFESWSTDTFADMVVEMHDIMRDIRAETGTDFTYSCDVPGGVDIDNDPLPGGVAYIYSGQTGGVLDDGAWFSSNDKYGGCPPQGSFWTSAGQLSTLLWDIHNGQFFRSDEVLPMITAYGSPDDRLIFDPPIQSPYLLANIDYSGGAVHWKGGDQPVTGEWSFVKDDTLLSGDYTLKSGHAAVVFLPYGQYAISIVNSGGLNSFSQATALKNAWVDALYAANPGLAIP